MKYTLWRDSVNIFLVTTNAMCVPKWVSLFLLACEAALLFKQLQPHAVALGSLAKKP